jgi:hypothetical protein
MRSLVALVAAVAVLAPAAARAEDREWEEDYSGGGWSDDPPAYDVSVDLNVSGGVSFESFQAPLASHGDWVVVGSYGRVWRPHVAAGWRPYYYGRWEWTNEGWFWVSDEPYGWAVYHYGRWAHDPYYGWIWVPGYQWAPAWVSWRMSGDVVGWAPLAPGLSVYVSTYPFVDFWWTFVPTARFVSVPVYSAAYAPAYTRQWYQRTAPAPARPAPAPGVRPAPAPTPAWGGPAPRLVADRIGRPLTPARIVSAPLGARARPGEIAVYRPGPAGRAPDAVRAPGWSADRGRAAAPRADVGRGPSAPAPGWNGQRGPAATPRTDAGRGPPAAPAPGWNGQRAPAAPPRAEPGRGPAPAWSGNRGGGQAAPAAPPSWRPEVRREAPPSAPAPHPRGEAQRGGGHGEERGRGR